MIKPVRNLLLVAAMAPFLLGCGESTVYKGDFNRNGREDKLVLKEDSKQGISSLILKEGEGGESLEKRLDFLGKVVGKPVVKDFDNDGFYEVLALVQNYFDDSSQGFDLRLFDLDRLKEKIIDTSYASQNRKSVQICELKNNSPIIGFDGGLFTFDGDNFKRGKLEGLLAGDGNFDINADSLGDYVVLDKENQRLNLMVSNQGKGYTSMPLDIEHENFSISFHDDMLKVTEMTRSYSENEIGFDMEMNMAIKTVDFYEMRETDYVLNNGNLSVSGVKEYTTEDANPIGLGRGGLKFVF